nr:probable envelope ADP,ATP carrier protein, chloroplastic [Tanacetum cinerariifolium]
MSALLTMIFVLLKKKKSDDLKGNQVDGLEVITHAINQLSNEFRSGTLSLELLGNSFMYMKNWFPDEYKLYGLSTIACSFALPLLSRLFEGWDPQIKPSDHTDIMSVWKYLLQGDEIDSPYAHLFMEVVLYAFMRSRSINIWQAKHPEPLLRFLYSWERLLPHAALERILCQIVMPKLLAVILEILSNPCETKSTLQIRNLISSTGVSMIEFEPTDAQLLKHPLAIVALVSTDAAVFAAGALSGAAAKNVTVPLDRVKLIMQCDESNWICAGLCIRREVTCPLDVLRLRLAVDPGYQTTTDVCLKKLKEEGLGSSLIKIAPYVAVNFCVFDLVKKSLPEKRQMQMRGAPYKTILDVFPAIVARDGVAGLYRGFVPNALKILQNSSIKLTTFDAMKRLISAGEIKFQRTLEENRTEQKQGANASSF